MATGSRVERKHKQKQQAKKPGGTRRFIRNSLIFLLVLFFILVLAGASLFGYYAMGAPNLSHRDLYGQVSSKIYDRQGSLIKEIGGQNRDLLEIGEAPDVLVNAFLAIEDARFPNHMGVDPIRIIGSALANLRAGEIVQGGSTITQQLVKLSVFSTDFQDQTLERKSQEAWLALQVEQEYSKKEILTLYLNKLFFSNNTYGAKTAAKNFFGKDISQITLVEAALLAGLPQAPTYYDPYANPEAAKDRRDLVLEEMYERGMISQEALQQAKAVSIESMLVPLESDSLKKLDLVIDPYLDLVAEEVQDKLNLNIYTDGIEVYTNMDFQAQELLYDTVNNNDSIGFPDDQVQVAASVLDVSTGQVVAIIGGRKQEVAMGLNRANTLNRSVGSTIKPLSAFGPAFEYGQASTGSLVIDEPYQYSNGDEIYNYDYAYEGQQTYREALAGSRNIPALKVLQKVGLDNAYAFLQKMNIHILNNNRKELVESNAIGGEITPLQLSAAYATLANYGVYNKPYTVNRVITQAGTEEVLSTQQHRAMKETTAYMLVDILKDVPPNFTSRADIPNIHHAGKTGTTNYTQDQLSQLGLDASTYAAPDGWYAGMTPQYAFAGWIGYDNPLESGHYLTLQDTAIPQAVYAEIMTQLMNGVPITDWKRPDTIVEVAIEKYTDPLLLPGPFTPGHAISTELFVKGTEPTDHSLAYGRHLPPPQGFTGDYNPENKSIDMAWSPIQTSGQFELTVNGQVVYTGHDTQFSIPAEEVGEYVLRLRIVDGNSSSDTLVITITLQEESESSDESSLEDTGDAPEIPHDIQSPPAGHQPPSDDPNAPPNQEGTPPPPE